MYLSSELIDLYLKDHFAFSVVGELSGELRYGRPTFWTASAADRARGIYLCFAEDLSAIPVSFNHSLLFVIGMCNQKPACDAMFSFAKDTSLPELFNSLHELFTRYDNWDANLSQLQSRGSPLESLLDCSQAVFENPILIHNRDFEFIAYSSIIEQTPSLHFLVEHERGQEAFSSFRLDADFQRTFLNTEPQFFPDTITGIGSAYINIFNKSAFIGRIVIPEVVRKLRDSDISLLQHLSNFILLSITNQNGHDNPDQLMTMSHLIGMILDGSLKEDTYIEKAMSNFRWNSDHDYFCIVLTMNQLDVQNNTTKMIRRKFELIIPECCTVEHEHEIVMFVNLTLNRLSQENVVHFCTELVRDSYLKMGYSRVYRGFRFGFQLLYQQARIALQFGTRYLPDIWIHNFDSIADRYMLEKLISDLPSEMVCVSDVADLYHYDQMHHTEYLSTLKVYLENNMQPVATARKLFIHRTTLMYRLDKIHKLFHLSLDSPKDRIFIQLSILLLESTLVNGSIG